MSNPPGGTDSEGYPRQWEPASSTSELNAMLFLITQSLNLANVATLVKVTAVTGNGVNPVGFVDVQPLVNLQDSQGNTSQRGETFNLPYFRLQGGKNAVICDPEVGDIGLAIFADRDISVVKNTKKISPPGSYRRNSLSDGLYIGGFLNAAPEQFVQFKTDGITITDKNANNIVMDADGIKINGVLFDRTRHVTNVVEVTADGGHTLTAHTHAQGNDSNGDTEVPTDAPTG
jgi:hypothetical protein